MSNQPQNLEEIPLGGTHVMDIKFKESHNGAYVNPDGYTPSDDPSPQVSLDWYIHDGANYNVAPSGNNPPSFSDLRYGGSTGRFLVNATAAGTVLSNALTAGERWAIGWTTTINTQMKTFFEFVTIVDSPAAEFGSGSYCDLADIRDDVNQLVEDEVYTIQATGTAVPESITFPDNTTKQLVYVIVNGIEITDYTFVKPNRIDFITPLAPTDVVEVKRDICQTDAQIHLQCKAVSDYVNTQLSKLYDVPFDAPYPPIVKTITMKLASAEIRMKLFDSTDRDGDRRGEAQWKRWHFKLEELRDGIVNLVDDNGDPIIQEGGSGILIDPTDLEPIFSLDDIPDIGHISNRTEWRYRRRGF